MGPSRAQQQPARSVLALALGACVLPAPALAAPDPSDARADKSDYTLFDPTPRELMRPLDASAPTETESPYTVDAGHLQIETVPAFFIRDRAQGGTTDAWGVFGTTLRLGLTNRLGLQLLFTPYVQWETRQSGAPNQTRDGCSDVGIRTKLNFWGNDPDTWPASAFGLVLGVDVPTRTEVSSDHVAGTLILPFAWSPSPDLELAGSADFRFGHDDDRNDYGTTLVHSAQVTYTLEGWGVFLEYAAGARLEGGAGYAPSLQMGAIRMLGADASLDVGGGVGLNQNAPEWNLALGITLRF